MRELIKAVGAGHRRARALTRQEARQAMDALVSTATPEQVGAFLLAMRMKGETAEELAGFVDAVDALEPPQGESVDLAIDAHGDGRLGRPSLLVAAAFILGQMGLSVRLCTRRSDDVHHHLATSFEAVEKIAGTARIAMQTLEGSHPSIERLVRLRPLIGVRTFAHTVAKVCLGPARRMAVGVFHRPYREITARTLSLCGREGLVFQAPGGLPELPAERPCPALRSNASDAEPMALDARHFCEEPDRGDLPEIVDSQQAAALVFGVLHGVRGPARAQALACAAGLLVAADRATDVAQAYAAANRALKAGAS